MSSASRYTSIILATYERPDALELVLCALAEEDDDALQVIVADDGSGDKVAEVVDRWRGRLDIGHVWPPNEGFRKARAVNLGTLAAHGEYLPPLDADRFPTGYS